MTSAPPGWARAVPPTSARPSSAARLGQPRGGCGRLAAWSREGCSRDRSPPRSDCRSRRSRHPSLQSRRSQLRRTPVEVPELVPPCVQRELVGPEHLRVSRAMPPADAVAEVTGRLKHPGRVAGEPGRVGEHATPRRAEMPVRLGLGAVLSGDPRLILCPLGQRLPMRRHHDSAVGWCGWSIPDVSGRNVAPLNAASREPACRFM